MAKNKLNIEYLAQLVNLTLGKKEKKLFQKQLQDSVDYIKVLRELKVDGVSPVAQVTKSMNIYNSDKVVKSLTQKQALSGASKKERGYFVTKRIKWE